VKWQPDGKYALVSGDWRITKNWTEAGWLYAVIRDRRVIGTAKSADEAKALCK
jgi:hypothetical protein